MPCQLTTRRFAFALVLLLLGPPLAAAPAYDFDRPQLEAVLHDLRAWLPGEWNSFPQVWYDRYVSMPEEGEHEHWHRTFALIQAPQIGDTVFYGQVNIGGPDGPILARSQVIYKTFIDEARGVVTILGQPVAEPERFADLHRYPKLWSEVQMPDEAGLNCRFDWRRHGRQLVGVLDNLERDDSGISEIGEIADASEDGGGEAGSSDEVSAEPPKEHGTCTYVAANGLDFLADAEWVLAPDELWLYDINKMGGVQFVGREDRTHLRLYRTTRYNCAVNGNERPRALAAHDRGFLLPLESDGGSKSLLLLRAWYPDDEIGLRDELRLWAMADGDLEKPVVITRPGSDFTAKHEGAVVTCLAE